MSSILELFRIPTDLTTEFLSMFARFEYALKRAGYLEGDDKRVSADWDRFGRDFAAAKPEILAPILTCGSYLISDPPKRQALEGGRLTWKKRGPSGGSPIEELLLSVRTVRNNVFHGGKFPEGPVSEPLRDERLIRNCVEVLGELLRSPALPERIGEYFRPDG
jgi:hypothetical protein